MSLWCYQSLSHFQRELRHGWIQICRSWSFESCMNRISFVQWGVSFAVICDHAHLSVISIGLLQLFVEIKVKELTGIIRGVQDVQQCFNHTLLFIPAWFRIRSTRDRRHATSHLFVTAEPDMEMVWRMIETRAWVGERSAVAEGERSG